MEPTLNQPNLSLQNAYEEINFYQAGTKNNKPVLTRSNGPANLAGLFAQCAETNNKQKQQEIFMCAQPFYVGEVDHDIEQIGLMAVKEVRYVDDEQWEEMVKENQRYLQALQKSKREQIKQTRKAHATVRSRNQKGQFITKEGKDKKIKKKGNKQKNKQKQKVGSKKQKNKTNN